jgi:KUP system potassium uptake protein
VVLVITGAEALYADMGHFGLKPIRFAWFGFVFPSLLLNYFGQGALLLEHPHAISNPFFLLAPEWALYPLLLLATLATIIASQAVISGAFSVFRQAIQLGYIPRMEILHTSSEEKGQIYVPAINWILMVLVLIVVVEFKTSASLASAYGIAVTGTMTAVTILASFVIKELWQWQKWRCAIFLITFLTIDSVFLFANSLKIHTGGWLPLLIGFVLFMIMTTWIKGRDLLINYFDREQLLYEDLEDELKNKEGATVKGTAIYFTKKTIHGVPAIFLYNFEHNHVFHERMIFLSVITKEVPYVSDEDRIQVHSFGLNNNIHRMKMYFGFMQTPDVKAGLKLCANDGIDIDFEETSFFIGSGRISFKKKSPMPRWRRPLFKFLFQNAASVIEFFKIPVTRVIELGIRIEL